MATNIVDSVPFQAAWADRPVLVISGENDKRIPISYVKQRIANLEQGSVHVTTAIYPNEDHFLVFSQPESVMQTVAKWLTGVK
jgi:pimeloyl-ACP methyl ester carboxylesterase